MREIVQNILEETKISIINTVWKVPGKPSLLYFYPNGIFERTYNTYQKTMGTWRQDKSNIVIGIDVSNVVIKTESFPTLPKKELEQTVNFCLQQDMGKIGDASECVFDYFPVGPDTMQKGNTKYFCH